MNTITSPLPFGQFSGQQVSPRAAEPRLSLDLIDQLKRLAPWPGSSPTKVKVMNLNRESLDLFERISESPAVVIGANCDLSREIESTIP